MRIILACICGMVIGYERKNRNKEAGIRTHSIVALGFALIMIVSKYGFADFPYADGSRIAAQIVSGIGFLRAGIIFVTNREHRYELGGFTMKDSTQGMYEIQSKLRRNHIEVVMMELQRDV